MLSDVVWDYLTLTKIIVKWDLRKMTGLNKGKYNIGDVGGLVENWIGKQSWNSGWDCF